MNLRAVIPEETRVIREPRTVGKWVGQQKTQMVPRTMVMRIPIDEFGNDLIVPSTPEVIQPQSVRKPAVPDQNGKTKKKVEKKATNSGDASAAAESFPAGDKKAAEKTDGEKASSEKAKTEAAKKPAESPAEEPRDSDETGKPKLEKVQPELNGPAGKVPDLLGTPGKSSLQKNQGIRIPARPKSA